MHLSTQKEFQKVADILRQIKGKIQPDTDTLWAGFDDGDEFLAELNQDIEKIEACDFATLDKVRVEFQPACTYQEIAISNGWGNDYLQFADNFDKLYSSITKNK